MRQYLTLQLPSSTLSFTEVTSQNFIPRYHNINLIPDQTFKARGRSIIQCLQPSVDGDRNDGLDLRILVIRRALDLLLRIDRALKEDRLVASELVQDLSRRKTVDGLLDLVSLEGIYPSLSPGVGIPIERRVRSVLRNGVVTRPSPSSDDSQLQDQSLLIEICLAFDEILSDGSGIGPTIQQRLLVDVIAGFGELVYSPSVEDKLSNSYLSCKLQTLLDRYVVLRDPRLLPFIFSFSAMI